ncbi:MAG: sensor histidine kinase [Pseudonocardia sp.]|nr:sensor histidine kinase [Pseudonocardia sp.]
MPVVARPGPGASPEAGLRHDGLFYSDDTSYLAGLLEFVHGGLERDEPVLVAVPGRNLELIRQGLGRDARRVRLADMAVAGRNPGRIIGTVLRAFAEEHAGHRVRIVGEPIWAGRSAEEYPACAEHEALINVALADTLVHVLCPYDTTRLAPSVLTDATRTHPDISDGSRRWTSPGYVDPVVAARSFDRPLSTPPEDADLLVLNGFTGLRAARARAHEVATAAGMDPARVADLRRIVQELAINTVVHSGCSGMLLIWLADGQVRVELQDGGRITDVLVGRRYPGPAHENHGLWLVNRLADLVRIHRHPAGTDIRVHVRI